VGWAFGNFGSTKILCVMRYKYMHYEEVYCSQNLWDPMGPSRYPLEGIEYKAETESRGEGGWGDLLTINTSGRRQISRTTHGYPLNISMHISTLTYPHSTLSPSPTSSCRRSPSNPLHADPPTSQLVSLHVSAEIQSQRNPSQILLEI